jgi:hypothetical protein
VGQIARGARLSGAHKQQAIQLQPNQINVDSIEAEENSINQNIFYLKKDFSGTRNWFTTLCVTIAKLTNLTQLTFDGLDTNARELEGFWGQISASSSLTTLNYISMDL